MDWEQRKSRRELGTGRKEWRLAGNREEKVEML
jgi:hypothetical protein